MKFVAFFRNVNLGQPRSPTRAQLEAAFLEAGASAAASFMSNGTLVFDVARAALAPRTARQARALLAPVCGLREPVYVRRFAHLAALVDEDPFAALPEPAAGERGFTVFEAPAGARPAAPIASPRGDCVVFRLDAGEAFSVAYPVGGKTGYPTPLIEAALGVPATTRAWRTVQRLVARFA